MAKPVSSIESHPQKIEIIDAILAGDSVRAVASRFGLTHGTVGRFKKHVVAPAILNRAKLLRKHPEVNETALQVAEARAVTKAAATAQPIIARLTARQERRERLLADAAEAKDFKGFAALDTCEHRDIRLEAELAGLLLQSPGASVTEITLMLSPSAAIPCAAIPCTVSPGPIQTATAVEFRALEPGDEDASEDASVSNSVEKDKS